MEKNNGASVFSRSIFLGEHSCESACDYSLPDYKSDLRRVLYSKAEVIPAASFIDSGEVCYSGVVSYSIVYLNGENELEGLEITSDYDGSVRFEGDGAECASVDTRAVNYSLRLVGPRKLQARANLSSEITLGESVCHEIGGDAFKNADTLQLSYSQFKVGRVRSFLSEERELAAKIGEVEGAIVDEIRVIHSSASARVTDAVLTVGGVELKGSVSVNSLLQVRDEAPMKLSAVIPFEETVSAEGLTDESSIFAEGRISSVKVEVNPDEFGCEITADVIAELSVTAHENTEVRAVDDAYLTDGYADCEYEDFAYDECLASICETVHAEGIAERAALGLAGARDIVLSDAVPKLQAEIDGDGTVRAVGEIKFSGIASEVGEGGELSFVSFKHSIPYEKKIGSISSGEGNVRCECRVAPLGVAVDIDKGQLCFSCDAAVSVFAREKKSTRLLTSMKLREIDGGGRSASRVTVYYPDSTDSLFGIAKKFRTTVRDIAVDNALTESVASRECEAGALSGIKRLIIK